jgi:hypothetical protein
MQNPFDVEAQYQKYLELAKLDESKMIPIQRRETRRAFMAGCGSMLLLMRDEISRMEEDKAIDAFQNMHHQILQFWLNESNRQN